MKQSANGKSKAQALMELIRRRAIPVCALILGGIQLPCGASGNPRPNLSGPLDEVSLDTAYLNDLMEERPYSTLLPYFEDLLQNRRYLGHIDSVFLFKNLGRMAIAQKETRDKGKAYLARAASMNPGAAVWDVYDTQLRQDYAHAQEAPVPETATTPTTNPAKEKTEPSASSWYQGNNLWWAAGGLGVAMIAATVTYVILQDSQSSESQKHSVVISGDSR